MAFVNGTYYDQFVFPGGTQKFIDGKVLDQFAWSQYDYDEKASRESSIPIGYIWADDGIYRWKLPIFNLNDITNNELRFFSGSRVCCFDLVPTNDLNGSNLRFYNGTNIKCVRSTNKIQYDFPPTVDNHYHNPPAPSDRDPIRFYATVSDSEGEVVSANLIWTNDAWTTENIISMIFVSTWTANLGPQTAGTYIGYKVIAWDDKWQSATSSISAFPVINPKK